MTVSIQDVRREVRQAVSRIRIIDSDSIVVLDGDHPMQPSIVAGGPGGAVLGPTLTDINAIALWDTATGDLLKNSGFSILEADPMVLRTFDAANPLDIIIQPGIASATDGASISIDGGHSNTGAGGTVFIKGGSQSPGSSPGGGNIDLFATNARSGDGQAGGLIRLQGGTNDDGGGPPVVNIRSSDLRVDGDVYANNFFSTAAPMNLTAPAGQTIESIIDTTPVLTVSSAGVDIPTKITDTEVIYGAGFDGGGVAVAVGAELEIRVEQGFTITGWFIIANQSGSIEIDVWVDTFANFPPTVADTITGGSPPDIVSSDKGSGGVGGWATAVNDGDVLKFHVNSVSGIQRCSVYLIGTRT